MIFKLHNPSIYSILNKNIKTIFVTRQSPKCIKFLYSTISHYLDISDSNISVIIEPEEKNSKLNRQHKYSIKYDNNKLIIAYSTIEDFNLLHIFIMTYSELYDPLYHFKIGNIAILADMPRYTIDIKYRFD